MALIALLAFSLILQGALGELVCEELPIGICAFSIASAGKRCLLETYTGKDGTMEVQCKTSEVVVNNFREHVETDECIAACGLSRKSIGISSDSLLEPGFTAKLCSPTCYQSCPNVVDLYYNLALAEGAFLGDICWAHRSNPRRAMAQIQSSGAASGPISSAAAGPASSTAVAWAPTSSVTAEDLGVACAPAPL